MARSNRSRAAVSLEAAASRMVWYGGYIDSFASSMAKAAALGGLALASLGNAEAPAPRNGMHFPSRRSRAIHSNGKSSIAFMACPSPHARQRVDDELKQLVAAVCHSERACRHTSIRIGMADVIDDRLVKPGVAQSRQHREPGCLVESR